MKRDVEHVVETLRRLSTCCRSLKLAIRHQSVSLRHNTHGKLWLLTLSRDLHQTKRKHTAICVMCDRFTRMVHCESCHDHATAKETAHIVMRQIFARHGCPRIILSDRGTQFDSELWEMYGIWWAQKYILLALIILKLMDWLNEWTAL